MRVEFAATAATAAAAATRRILIGITQYGVRFPPPHVVRMEHGAAPASQKLSTEHGVSGDLAAAAPQYGRSASPQPLAATTHLRRVHKQHQQRPEPGRSGPRAALS